MGFADFFSDLYASLSSPDACAEAPSGDINDSSDQGSGKETTVQQSGNAPTRGGVSTKTPASGTDEESPEEAEANAADAKGGDDNAGEGHKAGSGGDDEEEAPEEEEEEEEEEPEDIQPKIEEECKESKQCAPAKHHYDECVERVTKKQEENDGKSDEDCVEEFFHLAHCATQCAAPKLFAALK
ncbi:Non-heme 11 kDa protein of cytochrome bc1 complex [Saccharata proteae CBS 121410]|uniref:Cytochrome b-c1 complex subunit 6, mitochondrial n=1 Tax=Saccharata proteae CBS 121410 TaxID=1314787 RepID=A0A6A5YBV9_9PEZI|nr:Non-heme 11 kDa protein of cytochrome bc1 complex [Saccharata proteae CBS 121410]